MTAGEAATPRPVRSITTSERSSWLGKDCPHCHQPLAAGEPVVVCPQCHTAQHAACWTSHENTCGSDGCGFSTPVAERRRRAPAAAGEAPARPARPAGERPARPAAARAPRAPATVALRESPGLRTRAEVRERLERVLDDLEPVISDAADEVIATITPEHIATACQRAKEHPDLRYDFLRCLSGVDWRDEGREVVYQLFSTELFQKCTFKVRLPADSPRVPTVTSVWAGANWHEREAAELFGITFVGHPHPEPLLLQRNEKGEIIPGHILLKSFPLRPPEPPLELEG